MSRLAITPDRRNALLIAAGASAGVAQTVLLRKFVDGTDGSVPTWMPQIGQLGQFNQPSALLGIVLGAVGVVVGLYVPIDPKLKNVAVAYGGAAISTGLLSGLGLM